MAMPYSEVKRIFDAAVLTATPTVTSMGTSGAGVQLLIVNTGFSGTLDIQGSMTYGGTYVNLLYTILATGAMTHATAQLSYTTNTANHQIIVHAPMPFLKFVMARSAGSITLDARTFSEPFMLPAIA